MSDKCEIDECENPVQATVSQEGTSKQKRVCHGCVMVAMSMMETDE
jgi:hypothetical protein